jgi:dolichol-phosphate mannosyltransferase
MTPPQARPPIGKIVVLIPTFNERENLALLVPRLRASVPEADVLVLDDNSPDGTGDVADQLAAEDAQVHILHRKSKAGLGAAYLAGFAWALERGYDVMVEMDADGSHQPEQLPSLLGALANADVALGSRYVPGGSVVNWPMHRKVLSMGGNLYVRLSVCRSVTPQGGSGPTAPLRCEPWTCRRSPLRGTVFRSISRGGRYAAA